MALSLFRLRKGAKQGKAKKAKTEVDKDTLNRIALLKAEIKANPQGDHGERFFSIVREFFQKYFEIHYQFTYQELVEDIKKKRIDPQIKRQLMAFIEDITRIEFDRGDMTKTDQAAQLQRFESLVVSVGLEHQKHSPKLMENGIVRLIHRILSARKSIKLPTTAQAEPKEKKRPHPAFAALVSHLHLQESINAMIARLPLHRIKKDNLSHLCELFSEGYEALGQKDVQKARKCRDEIDSVYRALTPAEQGPFDEEIKALERQVKALERQQAPKAQQEHPRQQIPIEKQIPIETEQQLAEEKLRVPQMPLPPPPIPSLPARIEAAVDIVPTAIDPIEQQAELMLEESDQPTALLEMLPPPPIPSSLNGAEEIQAELYPILQQEDTGAPLDLEVPVLASPSPSRLTSIFKKLIKPLHAHTGEAKSAALEERQESGLIDSMDIPSPISPYPLPVAPRAVLEPPMPQSPPAELVSSDFDLQSLQLESIHHDQGIITPVVVQPMPNIQSQPALQLPAPVPAGQRNEGKPLTLDDLENTIQMAGALASHRDINEARNKYLEAQKLKRTLKLAKQQQMCIKYQLADVDLAIRMAGIGIV